MAYSNLPSADSERLLAKVDDLLRNMEFMIRESQADEEKMLQSLKNRLIMVQAMVHKRSKEILTDLEKKFKDKRENLRSFADEVYRLKSFHGTLLTNPTITNDLIEKKLEAMRRNISLKFNEDDIAKIADVIVNDCFKNNLKKKKIILLTENVDVKRIIAREDYIFVLKVMSGENTITIYTHQAIVVKDLWKGVGLATDFDIDFERNHIYLADAGNEVLKSRFSIDGLSFYTWSETYRVKNLYCIKNGIIIYETGGWYNDYCENVIMLDFEGTEVWKVKLTQQISLSVCPSQGHVAVLCGKTPVIYDLNGNPLNTLPPQKFDTDDAHLLSYNSFGLIGTFRKYGNKAFRFCDKTWRWMPMELGFKPTVLTVYNDLFETRIYALEESNRERRLYVFLN